jgi:N-methylhydantoinase B
VTFLTAGGGGAGDPVERPAEAVARDVELGYVSAKHASEEYGIVLSADGKLNQQATFERRKTDRTQ